MADLLDLYESFPYERGYGEFYRHSIYRDSLPYWKYSEKVSGHIVSDRRYFPSCARNRYLQDDLLYPDEGERTESVLRKADRRYCPGYGAGDRIRI